MDGIAALAVSTFELVQKFKEPNEDSLYHAVQVGISATDSRPDSGHPVHDGQGHEPTISQCEYEMPASTLPGWFAGNEGLTESQQDASFKAVQINRNEDVSLEISQECFAQLFEAMRADPAVKYMVCHDYDGFHEFGAPGYLKTRFIGTPIYALLWTFDPVEVATRALFIRRRHKPFSMFTRVLRAFHEHIYTPWLPGFVSCYLIQQWSDRETSGFELLVLREVEMETGFGPHPSGFSGLQPGGMEGKFDINVLTSWSQRVNEVSGNIGNKIRHQKISMTVLKMIVEASQTKTDKIASEFIAQKQRQSLDELSRAVPFLERQLNTYVDFLAYLKDRADKLSAVLFALLTHEDAAASINIATASKRDSSSMKTVAVMTMAFLPATFFAALFALPSLKWDQAPVIQDRFWVYWAFTLPCTAMVFIVWLLITQCKWIFVGLRVAVMGPD